ncbi:hypothetical protein Tco_0344826 [Tanacetum coccineum]
MDFHGLELMGDLLSIDVQIDEVGRMCAYLTDQHSERMTLLLHIFTISGYVTGATKDVKHAVVIASAQKNKGSLEAESIIRAASMRVRFRLLTTPFCSGVRRVEV